jgi:protein SCO1/2
MICRLLMGLLVLAVCGCNAQTPPTTPAPSAASNSSTQIFQVKGVIVELKPGENSVRIKHEEIPGYMDAMTMSFDVKSTNELTGLTAGDAVAFRMLVTEKDGWIDQVKKIDQPKTNAAPVAVVTNNPPTTGEFRLVREVVPLHEGDMLPEYNFTNQFGAPVKLSQFRGQAMAITFIFTRCPFPTYCPLMSNNFRDVQDALLKKANGPTNWQLLTITFDPEYDTPARLNNYSKSYNCDPKHWSFLTGQLIDITAIAEQFGEVFWRDATGSISHNLRTAVIDANGRVQKIYTENKWTAAELAEEITKAAAVK